MKLESSPAAARAAALAFVWFGAAFVVAFTANSLTIAMGVYQSGATLVGLIAGIEGLVLLGPIWHLNRDRPVTAVLFAAATAGAAFYAFRMLTGFTTVHVSLATKVIDTSMPLVIGAGSVLAYMALYRALGTGPRHPD